MRQISRLLNTTSLLQHPLTRKLILVQMLEFLQQVNFIVQKPHTNFIDASIRGRKTSMLFKCKVPLSHGVWANVLGPSDWCARVGGDPTVLRDSCCGGTTIHIVPTKGVTKLRQPSRLNETQVYPIPFY